MQAQSACRQGTAETCTVQMSPVRCPSFSHPGFPAFQFPQQLSKFSVCFSPAFQSSQQFSSFPSPHNQVAPGRCRAGRSAQRNRTSSGRDRKAP